MGLIDLSLMRDNILINTNTVTFSIQTYTGTFCKIYLRNTVIHNTQAFLSNTGIFSTFIIFVYEKKIMQIKIHTINSCNFSLPSLRITRLIHTKRGC